MVQQSSILKKAFIILILFTFVGLFVGGFYYYYYKNDKQLDNIMPEGNFVNSSRVLQEKNYFYAENLFELKSIPTMEYFRQRLLYHKYSSNSSPEKIFEQELESEFFGEKGKILVQLFRLYQLYSQQVNKIELDKNLDTFQKLIEIEKRRIEIFGQELSNKFFPITDMYLIEKFFAYSQRYNSNHYYDDARSKKIHIEKARAEIYGERLEELKNKEPFSKQVELELKLIERELSILSKLEKEQRIQEIRDKLR